MTMDPAEKARHRRRIWLALGVTFLVLPAVLFLLFLFLLMGTGHTWEGRMFGGAAAALFAGSLWALSDRAPWLRKGAAVAFLASAGLAIGAFGWVSYRDSLTWVVANDVSIYAYDPSAGGNRLARLGHPSTLILTADEAPRLDGATALYPLYAAFALHTYPKALLQRDALAPRQHVNVGKTSGAYQALNEGQADIIFVAGPSAAQREAASAAGVDLHLTPIGREAFVFYVASDNPVTGLTQDQVRAIYTGEITNWSDLGGKRRAIRAFQRPADSGSQTMLERIMGNAPIMPAPRETRIGGMFEVVNQTADFRSYPGAIGYSFRVFVANILNGGNVRLLAIDGVEPTVETIADGSYPFTTEFYAVTDGPPDPAEARLIDWIRSSEGRSLIEKTGYVPLAVAPGG